MKPGLVGQPAVKGFFEHDFSFADQLNGITFSGQSIALDFVFEDDVFARVRGIEGELDFIALLNIQTNATTFPGFVGEDATGFLLSRKATPLHAPLGPEQVGRAMGSDGSTSVGLFPTIDNFRMIGVHYELTLPTTGYVVTGGMIRLGSNAPDVSIRFDTARPVPEPATLLLLSTSLAAMGARRLFKSSKGT